MYHKGRRAAVAAFAVLSACVWGSGCVNTQSAFQPMLSPTGPAMMSGQTIQQGGASVAAAAPASGWATKKGRPTLSAAVAPGQEIQQAAFFAAPHPAGHGPVVGEHAGEVVMDGGMVHPGGMPGGAPDVGGPPLPVELTMSSHPPHRVAPPDILKIDALRLIPRGPYRLSPLETVQVTVSDTLPNQPITGNFLISPDGTLNLGYGYGTVRIGGLTVDQAQEAVRKALGGVLKNPSVNIAVTQFRTLQQIGGDHLVRPDGTIDLGMYGSVYVAGLTLGQVKCVIEKHLEAYLVDPQVSVDVFAYNSRKYYVIVDGGGFGQQVIPLPSTGNETVLDAISNVQGLAPVSSKHRIWVARPSPCNSNCNVVLPVDWNAITQGGSTCTNYQLFPGDRVYVAANKLIALDNYLSQVFAPIERIFGITLLGQTTIRSFSSNGGAGNTGGFFVVP